MDNRGVLRSFLICVKCQCTTEIVEKLKWDLWKKTLETGKFLYQVRPTICIGCINDLSTSKADAKLFRDKYYEKNININIIENSAAAWLIRKKYNCELTCYNDTTIGIECKIELLEDVLLTLKDYYRAEYPIQCNKHRLYYTVSD